MKGAGSEGAINTIHGSVHAIIIETLFLPADAPSSFNDFCTLVARARISLSVNKTDIKTSN